MFHTPDSPARIEDVAFATVRDLGLLLQMRKITSLALTQMYIDRLKHYDAKYAAERRDSRTALASDLCTRIGFQMLAAYRVMRFCVEAEVPLAPGKAAAILQKPVSETQLLAALRPLTKSPP